MINGVVTDYLNINDRAIHYGDGLFETILGCNHSLYYWPQHYQRLHESCQKIKLKCPGEQLLLSDIRQLLVKNNDQHIRHYLPAHCYQVSYIYASSRFRLMKAWPG